MPIISDHDAMIDYLSGLDCSLANLGYEGCQAASRQWGRVPPKARQLVESIEINEDVISLLADCILTSTRFQPVAPVFASCLGYRQNGNHQAPRIPKRTRRPSTSTGGAQDDESWERKKRENIIQALAGMYEGQGINKDQALARAKAEVPIA